MSIPRNNVLIYKSIITPLMLLFTPLAHSVEYKDYFSWTKDQVCSSFEWCTGKDYSKKVKILSGRDGTPLEARIFTNHSRRQFNKILLCPVEIVATASGREQNVGKTGYIQCSSTLTGEARNFPLKVIESHKKGLIELTLESRKKLDISFLNKIKREFPYFSSSPSLLSAIRGVDSVLGEQREKALVKLEKATTFEMKSELVKLYRDNKYVSGDNGYRYNDIISASQYNKLIDDLYHELAQKNSLARYVTFLSDHTKFKYANEIKHKILKIIDDEDSIAGYAWFLSQYPDSQYAKESLQKLHHVAFKLADDIDTIASYNDFIIAYPTAKQVQQANERAFELEKDKYTGFFSDEEKEARRLLVQSKILEQGSESVPSDQRVGYMIVVNRMNDLLKQEFDSTDAALRHLESNEFKNFVRSFQRAMNKLTRQVQQLSDNTQDLSLIMKNQSSLMNNHFEKAAQDREMAAELTKQHRQWERFIGKVGQ